MVRCFRRGKGLFSVKTGQRVKSKNCSSTTKIPKKFQKKKSKHRRRR